jgi:hypothetical protein
MGAKFTLKADEPGSNNVPGPGAYPINLSPIKIKGASYKIGTSRRDQEDRIK